MTNLIDLYPHNKVVFNKVLENLKTHNKVGVVQATGTGKGKLAACFVEFLIYHKPNAKILIVAPLRSVLQNYRDNFSIHSDNVKFVTYQKINSLKDEELINIGQYYDLIVLDEYHRCGATEWYKSIQKLFIGVSKGKCKVIGLTATPIRYLDNARDMSEELFDNNIVQGIDLEEAIVDGILPGFIYNACYFGSEKVLRDVKNGLKKNEYKIEDSSVKNHLLSRVDNLIMLYENKYKISNIIREQTKKLSKNQKWVIFCKDKKNLEDIYTACVDWFNATPIIYVINSDKDTVENDKTLLDFRNSKVGINVLLCINMLNEGVHIKDLNGVIMLRKTDSPILFLQQLGRSLEVGKDFKPVIFDLIGNYRGLRIDEEQLGVNSISIVKEIEKNTKNLKNYIIIHNYIEEMDNVLNEIRKYSFKDHDGWTPEEDDILKEYYPKGGYVLCQKMGLYRSKGAIRARSKFLNLKCMPLVNSFSSEDLEIIEKYYSLGGSALCKKQSITLNNRKSTEISYVARFLFGLNYDRSFTSDEDAIIQKYYTEYGTKGCIDNGVNRSAGVIAKRANDLGLKYEGIWKDWEIEILKKYYPIGGSSLCNEKGLLEKDRVQMKSKARRLGLYSPSSNNIFTKEEEDIILKYYLVGGAELCQEKGLKKSLKAIKEKAYRLNIVERGESSPWTKEEDDIIDMYYREGGYLLCQEKGLKRAKPAIQRRANLIGVTVKAHWTEEEDNILKEFFHLGIEECKKQGLGHRTDKAIENRIKRLKLKENNNPVWEIEEINILKKYYPLGGYQLCQKQGLSHRSKKSIYSRAYILGITGKMEK